MNGMAERKVHKRDQSQLYKITSPSQLCKRLQISRAQLEALLKSDDKYIRWNDKNTGRPIQQPKPVLAQVHKRVATLLSRIETPDFLHSAVKGRSYISNASGHDPGMPSVKIDLRKFYPSTRSQAVFHFFLDRMKCDRDVAGILAKLLTVDGHLATGSSVSPILSYFAYEDMFLEMEALAKARGCLMSCYVDDMVFTGPGATRELIYRAIQVVRKFRLWGHKTKIFMAGQSKIITGVAVTKVGGRLPNRRQAAITGDLVRLRTATSDQERLEIMSGLVGRLYEAAQIDQAWTVKANAMSNRMKSLRCALLRSAP